MNQDLSDEQKREVWLIACKYGVDQNRARAMWENERRARNIQFKPNEEPIEEEPLEEEDVQETETEESELSDLKLENEKKKSEILDQIADRLDAEETAEQQADDLIKFIKSAPEVEQSVKGFLGLMLAFPRYPDVQRVIITMTREGSNVHFASKALDKNGKDVMFDSKTGNVVKMD